MITPPQHLQTGRLTVRKITTRAFRVPLKFPLGTSVRTLTVVPLVLVDVQTEEGPIGRSYVFGYTEAGARAIAACLEEVAEVVRGHCSAPHGFGDLLTTRFKLFGITGAVRMALSAFDIAIWDAAAIAAGLPVATMLGADRTWVAAYDSRGLGLMPTDDLARQSEQLLELGLGALKLRLGYASLAEDVAALQTVRKQVPGHVSIMVDYNQALTTAEAIRRGKALQQEGILWLEEPIRHDDYRGNARIAGNLDVPVQIGENFNGPEAMADALALSACDYVMPDIARIGGMTGWMQAAGIAAGHGIEMSSHLMPELSIHALCASPTAHWIEYVDWADPILEQPVSIENGGIRVPDRPGLGISWSEEKLRHLDMI
jgi:mandelate racemase